MNRRRLPRPDTREDRESEFAPTAGFGWCESGIRPRWIPTRTREPGTTTIPRGFTLLELVIVIILVILLFLTVWNRLMPLRGDAESAHVASIIGNLRSALGLATAERVVTEGMQALESLRAVNPMTLLDEAPDTYIGVNPAEPAPGNWYFDTQTRQLQYRVRYPQYREGQPQPPVDLSWQVILEGDDNKPKGIRLRALHDHRWPGDSRPMREIRETAGQTVGRQQADASSQPQ